MENLEFTAFCTPESLWQRQMLYFFFFQYEVFRAETVKKKIQHQRGGKILHSWVYKCARASLCFWHLKRYLCPLSRSWWTCGLPPQNVCLSCGSQTGLEEGTSVAATLVLPFSPHTEGDRNELQQQGAGPWVTQTLVIPREFATILTPFPNPQFWGG